MASVNKTECDAAVRKIKLRKARFATFKVRNDPNQLLEVVPDFISERKVGFSDLQNHLNETQAAYILYDKEFRTHDGRLTSSLIFIYWVPNNCNQNDRILYSSAKGNFAHILEGFKLYNLEDMEELEELFANEVVA